VIGNVIGNYVVKEKVGEGGMGAVYLAEHPRLGRKVAIKLLHSQFNRNPEFVSRFFVEAKAATEIGSDHIVGVLDFGELSDGASYIVLEWLDGHSLHEVLATEKKLSLVRAIHIARGVARALYAAHAIGIVHRDLKPDNVFLVRKEDDPEFVKVLDFGIAKLMPEGNEQLRVKTETGALIGTPQYMSPEQCRGADRVDQRTDIYALGVICYEMLSGRLPFLSTGLGDLLIAHMTETPPTLRSLEPSIPEAVDDAIMKALAKTPEERFQRIDGFVDALSRAWSESGPIDAAAMPAAPGAAEVRSRQSTLTGTAAEMIASAPTRTRATVRVAGVVLAAVATAGLVAWRARHKPELSTSVTKAASAPTGAMPTPLPATPTPPPTVPSVVTPPPVEAPRVKLEVQATPAGAQLILDGKPLANPFSGELPRDAIEHQLAVRATGYKSETRTLTLDRDRAIEVRLARELKRPAGDLLHAHAATPPTTSNATAPPPEPGKPIYKGTKGTLITDFPEK
jgi:serine/threonine-protein kinase